MLTTLIVVLNALGFIPAFSTFWADHVYGLLTLPLSHLSALAPLLVGELLMYAAALMLVAGIMLGLLRLALRRRKRLAAGARAYGKVLLAVLLTALLLYTLNWSIPIRATPLSARYAGSKHTLDDLEELRAYMVAGLNACAEGAPRTADGLLDYGSGTDLRVASALNAASGELPRLAGYMPSPKEALCSDMLEWMGIGGYTYPYTQEITINRHVSRLYRPVLVAHESAHHKGYYLESEAEFAAFIACAQSNDAILRYSGFQSAYYYVESAYARALASAYSEDEAVARYRDQPQLSAQVLADFECDKAERQQAYEESVNHGAEEAFSGLAGDVAEYGWAAQDHVLDLESYSGMVRLLLGWYAEVH